MSLSQFVQDVADAADSLAALEAGGPTVDNYVRVDKAIDELRLKYVTARRMWEAAEAKFALFKQPTAEQRAEHEQVRRDNSPHIAVLGRGDGMKEEIVQAAEANTKEQLAEINDRNPDEERLYQAMPTSREEMAGVSIIDLIRARTEVARVQAAVKLASARSYDNDRSVTSYNLLDRAEADARLAVNESLDRDFGRGTAAAVATLRPALEVERQLHQAVRDGASPESIADLQNDLRGKLVHDDIELGDERMRLTVNLLPEPARSDFKKILDNEQRGVEQTVEAEQIRTGQDQSPGLAPPVSDDIVRDLWPGMRAVVEAEQAVRQAEASGMPIETIEELNILLYDRAKITLRSIDTGVTFDDLRALPEPQRAGISMVFETLISEEMSKNYPGRRDFIEPETEVTKLAKDLSKSYELRWEPRGADYSIQSPQATVESEITRRSSQMERAASIAASIAEVDEAIARHADQFEPAVLVEHTEPLVAQQGRTAETISASAQPMHEAVSNAIKRQARIEEGKQKYQTDPVEHARIDYLARQLDKRIDDAAKTMAGGLLPQRAVEERLELAQIMGDGLYANALRGALQTAQMDGVALTINHIPEQFQDPKVNAWRRDAAARGHAWARGQ